MKVKRILTTAVVVLGLVAGAACGDDSPNESTATTVAEAQPKRIVSMSATATEMLFAVGAGKQVVAVDDQSNYPASVPKTQLSAYNPSVEAIAGYNPDLVVISNDTKGLKQQLETLKIAVIVEPAGKTINDTYTQLEDLGRRTGHLDKAKQVVASLKKRLADLKKSVPTRSKPLTYYHELDNTLFTVTSKTFIGDVYAHAGLQNVADPADAGGQAGGYPQLSAEYLVKADPDLIFLADTKCCQQTKDTLAARPGFAGLKAVKSGQVVLLDDDIASRWGPRVVDLLTTIINAVKAVPNQ
jgi:iron complex transport system substrate-binding protein